MYVFSLLDNFTWVCLILQAVCRLFDRFFIILPTFHCYDGSSSVLARTPGFDVAGFCFQTRSRLSLSSLLRHAAIFRSVTLGTQASLVTNSTVRRPFCARNHFATTLTLYFQVRCQCVLDTAQVRGFLRFKGRCSISRLSSFVAAFANDSLPFPASLQAFQFFC